MVDFWEVYGRMLTNDDFRRLLYKRCPHKFYKVGEEVSSLHNKGLDIPRNKYDAVRNIIADIITDGPVSLSTVGEVLMILSSRNFRNLADDLAAWIQATVNTDMGSKLFYTAIGCMTLDGFVLGKFADSEFDDIQFGRLTGLERNALKTLANSGDVLGAATTACKEFWDIACSDDFAFYPIRGTANRFHLNFATHHFHPIVVPYPPAQPQPRYGRPPLSGKKV